MENTVPNGCYTMRSASRLNVSEKETMQGIRANRTKISNKWIIFFFSPLFWRRGLIEWLITSSRWSLKLAYFALSTVFLTTTITIERVKWSRPMWGWGKSNWDRRRGIISKLFTNFSVPATPNEDSSKKRLWQLNKRERENVCQRSKESNCRQYCLLPVNKQ